MTAPRCAPEKKCRHRMCPRRAVRQGVCPDHWTELWGTGHGPWPDDIEPASWRDRYLKRTGRPYVDAAAVSAPA